MDSDKKKIPLFKTLKIKLNAFTDEEIIELLTTLSRTHTVRLDAQREPLSSILMDFLLSHEELYEYIEEPKLTSHKANELKIALDETLYIEKQIPQLPNLQALVYKPTLCGGLQEITPCWSSSTTVAAGKPSEPCLHWR